MSMLKKVIVAAAIVIAAGSSLASDVSGDVTATRRPTQESSDSRRQGTRERTPDVNKLEKENAAVPAARCECPCAMPQGYRSGQDTVPDYGG